MKGFKGKIVPAERRMLYKLEKNRLFVGNIPRAHDFLPRHRFLTQRKLCIWEEGLSSVETHRRVYL